MPRILQFRRGNTSQVETYTGAEGEIVIDIEAKTIRVHDGVVVGGHPMLSKTENETLLASMTQMATDQADLDAVTTQIQTDFSALDTRLSSLEGTQFWKTEADGYYAQKSDTYTIAQIDSIVTNRIGTLESTVANDYARKADVYTQQEVVDLIGSNLASFATTANLTQYRLVADSLSKTEIDQKFTDISLTYYTKNDSDTLYRRLDDSKSAAEVDTEFSNLRNETFDRGYINSTFATITGTYSRADADEFFQLKAEALTREETIAMIEENAFQGGRILIVDDTASSGLVSGITLREEDTQVTVHFVGTHGTGVNQVNMTTDGVVVSGVVATETDEEIEISFIKEA